MQGTKNVIYLSCQKKITMNVDNVKSQMRKAC